MRVHYNAIVQHPHDYAIYKINALYSPLLHYNMTSSWLQGLPFHI